MRHLAISAHHVKQQHADLEKARNEHERLKTEADALQHELVRLRRIAANKPDVARLQELRNTLKAFDNLPAMPADARRIRDDATVTFNEASSQVHTLKTRAENRRERIDKLQISGILKAHSQEIEDLIGETNDYHRGVTDRPKRISERNTAMEKARLAWSQIWRDHPIEEAEELRNAYSRKSEVFRLASDHAVLAEALRSAGEQSRNARERQDRLQNDLRHSPDPGDPSVLLAEIEHAKALGDVGSAVTRLRSEITRLTDQLNRDVKQLRGWSGPIEDLELANVPSQRTIDRYASEWEKLRNSATDRKIQLRSLEDSIGKRRLEMAALTARVGGFSDAALSEARRERDRLWELISASAIRGEISGEEARERAGIQVPIDSEFAASVQRADGLSDIRFAYAADVVIHDRLAKEIEALQEDQRRLSTQLTELREAEEKVRTSWVADWAGIQCDIGSPPEMKDWLNVRESIINRLGQRRDKQEELEQLEARSAAASAQLIRSLEVFQKATQDCPPLPILIRVADSLASQIQERRRAIADTERQLRELSPEKLHLKEQECRERLKEWAADWQGITTAWHLPPEFGPEQVSAAVEILQEVFDHLRDAEALRHRISRIGDNISLFESRVRQLVNAVDPILVSQPADVAVRDLHSKLVATGNAETERQALEQQDSTDQEEVARLGIKVQRAEAALRDLKEVARCNTTQELEAVIASSESATEKKEEFERIARSLVERNGAPELQQIEDEASAYELDSLNAAIANGDSRLRNIQDDAFKAGVGYGTLQQAFARLESSDESTAKAQKAEDALGRIRPALAHYLRLQFATEILQRSIENYREKHQGPVLGRAGQLFSELTLGDYSGLTTAFTENDKSVLVAVRRNKQNVEVDGLSDGTRDQMYLALRLAAIEHHVETVSPCPVILDDILINADDTRATATLQVLSSLASKTQVLLFTHHRHLAALARDAGAYIMELGGALMTAGV